MRIVTPNKGRRYIGFICSYKSPSPEETHLALPSKVKDDDRPLRRVARVNLIFGHKH